MSNHYTLPDDDKVTVARAQEVGNAQCVHFGDINSTRPLHYTSAPGYTEMQVPREMPRTTHLPTRMTCLYLPVAVGLEF